MRGFQPQTKRKVHANGYADGGMVQGIKRAFGMDEERNARISAYRARAAQEKAAAAAAAQPAAPASAPSDRAISDYSGMGATQRREKTAGLKDGGMVRGPGTGISDDVPDQVPEGTYIMPADSTAQLGPDKLASMGARGFNAGGKKAAGGKSVPVNLSNGEFKLPPEQVHAVGVQALEQMKNATHTPAAQQAGEPEMFFANGGPVFGSRGLEGLKAMIPKVAAMGFPQKQAAPVAPVAPAQGSRNVADLKAMIPQMEAMGFKQNPQYLADGGQVRARWEDNLDELQNPTPYQGQVGNLFLQPSGTAAQVAAIRPGVYRGDAGRGTVNPPAVAPQNTTQPDSATDPASTSLAGAGRGTVNPPMANPSAPAPTNAQAPGSTTGNVTRVGNTYSGTNVSGDITVNGQAPRGGFMVADGPRGFSPGAPSTTAPQGVTAPTVRRLTSHELRNLEVSASSIMNREKWGGKGAQENPSVLAYKAALANDAAAQAGQVTLDGEAMRQTGGIQREGMQQDGATTRTGMTEQGANTREAGRNTLATEELGLKREAQGFQTRAAQQQEQLRNVLLDPKATAAQKRQAQESLRALGVKIEDNRFTVVPGGQEWDATAGAMRNVPARVLNNQTGQFVDQGARALPPIEQNPQAVAIKANTTMTREQKAEALRQLGY